MCPLRALLAMPKGEVERRPDAGSSRAAGVWTCLRRLLGHTLPSICTRSLTPGTLAGATGEAHTSQILPLQCSCHLCISHMDQSPLDGTGASAFSLSL